MLALDRTFGPFGDLAVYGDHEDPALFYFIPTTPTLARTEGEPELSFVKYRRDLSTADVEGPLGGGLLGFTVELLAKEEDLELARRELRKLGVEEVRLTPLPTRSGSAKLTMVSERKAGDTGLVLFESVLSETTPALFGTQRATFSARLPSHESAELVAGLLRGEGPIPIGVRYELEYLGIRPAIAARIVAHFERIYHQFKAELGIGVAYNGIGVEAEVGVAIQKLKENGAIEVEIFELSDEGGIRERTEEVLRRYQEDLVRTFFKSSLPPEGGQQDVLSAVLAAAKELGAATLGEVLSRSGAAEAIADKLGLPPAAVRELARNNPNAGGQGGGGPPFQLKVAFTLKHIDQEELKTQTLDYRVAAAEKRIAAPQGLLDGLGVGPAQRALMEEVDLGGAYYERLSARVRPVAGLAELGVDKLVVHLEYPAERPDGESPLAAKSFVFEAAGGEPVSFAAWAEGRKDLRYRYRAEAHFRHDGPYRGNEPAIFSDWRVTDARELVVTPATFVDFRAVELRRGTLEFRDVPSLEVEVRLGDDTALVTQVASLSEQAPAATLRFRVPKGHEGPAERRLTWFLASGLRVEGAWEPFAGDAVLYHGPFRGRRELRLVPLLPPGFVDCVVAIGYQEEGYERRELVTFAAGENKAKVLSFPTLAAEAAPVHLQTFVTRADATFFQGPEVETRDPVYLVTDQPKPARRVTVELVAAGKLAELGVAAVKVELLGGADGQTVTDALLFTESRRGPVVWVVPEPEEGPFVARYRVVRYGVDGNPVPGEIETTTGGAVLVAARG
jgi:hypothetical protein